MESERGYDNPTTFNNTDAVSFQALHQTINTDSIVLNNGQTRAYMNIDEEVLGSLAFPEMHQRQSNIEKPHMHTCSWILKLKEYNDWMNASNGLLWIKGKPGSGKSTIMAFLYQQIMKPHTAEKGIALEFFFSARGSELQRTPLGLFRTLLNQLYRQDFNLCTVLREVYQDKCDSFGRSKHGWEWQLPELERVFYDNIAISAQRQPLIIFVDALDEAGQESARYLAKFFHHVNDLIKKRPASGKICIACRHYPGITSTCGIEIVVEDHNHDDITTYVRDSLPLGFPLSPGTPSYQSWDSVVNDLIKSAHGVFLWIRLVVPLVEKRVQDGESPENIQRFLRKVPQKLGDVYEDILRNTIEQEYRSQASLLFQWVCLAERPLSVTEMRYAMSARDISMSPSRVRCNETSTFVTSDELMKLRIRAWSGGLIEAIIDQKSTTETVQVIHQSVNDFIVDKGLVVLSGLHDGEQKRCQLEGRQWNSTFMMKHSQGVIYRSCLNYLATEDVQVTSDDNKERLLQRWPFLNYATIQIFMHARKAVEHRFGNVEKEVFLLQHVIQKWIASYSLMDGFSPMCPVPITTLLHIGSASNMTDIIKDLVCRKIYLNEEDSIGSTALHYAANYGSTEAAEILLRSGADINLKNQRSVTPLVSAAGHGQKALVELLLREGSNVNESTGYSGNALQQAASSKGSKEVVQVLLNAGADINAQGGQFGNALQGASYQGSKEVVQVLLNAGADVNAQGGKYGNALQAASFRGSKDVVQLLLNAGADVNAQGGEYGNALQAASFRGSKDVVQLLLNAGANVNAQGGIYGNALQAASASFQRPKELVQILLDAGADVNAQGGEYGNALQAASFRGSKDVVQLLLNAGANVNAQGGHFGNALQGASSEGTKEVVQLLLSAGANVNAQGGIYGNALQTASSEGTKEVVQLLLSAGANVNAQGGIYGNALQAASSEGTKEVVRMLLDAGANVNAQGGEYGNALQAASFRGSKDVVQLLLNAGADVNAQGGKYGNALQAASFRGSKDVVQLLLNAGADVNAQGGEYGNALQAASSEGTKEVVRMLLDAGANVNAQGGIYGNALQAASFRGSKDVVQVLLNAGADVNAQGGQYGNALIAAIFRQRRNVIALLLANGINPSLPSQNGQTAAHIAARAGSSAIIDIIKINPACLHTKDLFDRTPIHLAIYSGHLKHIPLWSTGDHDHPIMDHYGKTLQDWATRDQAMSIELQKYLPVLPPTPNHIQIKVLSQSVRTLTKKLLYTNRWASPGLFELGRCLMLLEKFDDARFVLSQQAAQVSTYDIIENAVKCHVCHSSWQARSRFICKACPEVDLCSFCMARYPHRRNLPSCKSHDFLEIPYPDGNHESSCIMSDNVQEWFRRLLIRFSESQDHLSEDTPGSNLKRIANHVINSIMTAAIMIGVLTFYFISKYM